MPRVHVMPDALASQVAAGEVVERPASVVKELVENSLDAGAKELRVESQRGGVALVRVSDDGCGMDREDALLSLERHATSKLENQEQLNAVGTLGFRGEALPSIAAVSKLTMTAALLFVAILDPRSSADRLHVRNSGYRHLQFDAKFALHLLDGDIKVRVAQPLHDDLKGLFISRNDQGRVFFRNSRQRTGHLVNISFGLGRNGHVMHGNREIQALDGFRGSL